MKNLNELKAIAAEWGYTLVENGKQFDLYYDNKRVGIYYSVKQINSAFRHLIYG